MEFKEISLSIPDEIKELSKAIERIEKNSCIAGGFLSDLYMGVPFHDVDFFIKDINYSYDDFFKRLAYFCTLKNMTCITDDYYGSVNGIQDVYEAYLGEYKINFIFTNRGKDAPKYFDVQFREFFYHKGKCFASDEALEDIKNKELKPGLVNNPIVSLYRLFSFRKRYGFTINEESLEPIIHTYLMWGCNTHYVKDVLSPKKYEDDMKDEVVNYFQIVQPVTDRSEIKKYTFLQQVGSGSADFTRKQFQKVFFQTDAYKKDFVFEIPKNFFLDKAKELEEEVKREFKKQLVRLTLDDPEEANEMAQNIDDPTYFHYIFIPKVQRMVHGYGFLDPMEKTKPYLNKTNEKIQYLQALSNICVNLAKTFTITIDEEDCFIDGSITVSEYLKRRYFKVEIKNNVFSCVYDLKEQKFTNYFNPSSYYLLREFIDKALNDLNEKIMYCEEEIA